MLNPAFHLALVNAALQSGPPEAPQGQRPQVQSPPHTVFIEQHLRDQGVANGRLDQYRPAAHLLREQTTLIPKIAKDTLHRADALFKRLNSPQAWPWIKAAVATFTAVLAISMRT